MEEPQNNSANSSASLSYRKALTCPVCGHKFNDTHIPCMLDACSHTVCLLCIKTSKSATIGCPICSVDNTKYTTNNALQQIIAINASKKRYKRLYRCKVHKRAPDLFCFDDYEMICFQCFVQGHFEHLTCSLEVSKDFYQTQKVPHSSFYLSAYRQQVSDIIMDIQIQKERIESLINKGQEIIRQKGEELIEQLRQQIARQTENMKQALELELDHLNRLQQALIQKEVELGDIREPVDDILSMNHYCNKVLSLDIGLLAPDMKQLQIMIQQDYHFAVKFIQNLFEFEVTYNKPEVSVIENIKRLQSARAELEDLQPEQTIVKTLHKMFSKSVKHRLDLANQNASGTRSLAFPRR